MKLETVFSYQADRRNATINREPSMTQQSNADEANLNVIMDRYLSTGQLPQVRADAIQGDFTSVFDYRTAVEAIRDSNDAFQELPAEIRKKFGNDPGNFIEFASNPDNLEELRKMKLADPLPPAETTLADINETLKGLKPGDSK